MITYLITFLIIFFLFRMVMPHLLRWALQAFLKKTIRNGTFMNANGPFSQASQPQPEPEGKVKVDYVPQDKTATPREFPGGEYVEYEEVK